MANPASGSGSEKTNHRLPGQELTAIECPLVIKKTTDPESDWKRLIDRLGGPDTLSVKLKGQNPNYPIELQLGPRPSHVLHPIPGEWVPTNNILLKVVKRRRKKRDGESEAGDGMPDQLFKIEPIGMISNTVRFRHMADFQYIPDAQHPISKLANDMKHLNPEGVLNFRFKPETEDYSPSQIGLFPPPIFSRYVVPQIYQYKHHSASVLSKTSAGTERLVNKARYTCSTPQSITFENPNVPQAALPSHLKMKRPEDEALYQKALSLFEQRPIWARLAFQNQLTPTELRALRYNKHLLAYTCYMFSDGAFRDLLVKFGYDPRVDSNARFYQRISIRNLDNKKLAEKFTFKLMRHPFSKDTDQSTGQNDSNRRSHVFDGLELNQSVGTYQLCDITDPLLKRLIESPKGVQEKCRIRDGWYTSNAIEQIRSILRRKFHGLLDNGRKVTDLECVDLLEIDVSCDAAGLLKRPKSVGERRFGGKNVGFDPLAGQVVLDGDSDSDNGLGRREAGETGSERRVGAHALGPNPLLRTRRAKSRAKAKKRTGPLERDAIDEENEEDMDRDGIASSQPDLNDPSREPGKGPEASSSSLSEAQRGETGGGEVEMMMKTMSMDEDDEDEEEEEEDEESEEFEGYEDEDDSLTDIGEEHDEEDLMIGCEGSSGSEEEEEVEESD